VVAATEWPRATSTSTAIPTCTSCTRDKSGAYNLPDVFLINDGTGTGFRTTPIPETSAGSGFSVAPIQADPDPEMEFLVTNGRADFTGPIQLIDFTPPST
jgi:hypothetical protein